jgi:hypothetical protein
MRHQTYNNSSTSKSKKKKKQYIIGIDARARQQDIVG